MIYLDEYFVTNMLMNAAAICIYIWACGFKFSLKKILTASALLSLLACVVIICKENRYVIMALYPAALMSALYIVAGRTAFTTFTNVIKNTVYLHFSFYILAGVIIRFVKGDINRCSIFVVTGIFVPISYCIIGQGRFVRDRSRHENVFTITIIRNNKKMRAKAYYDSGCRLYEPISGSPCMLAEYDAVKEIITAGEKAYIDIFPGLPPEWDGKTHVRSIPYTSVGKERGYLPGIIIDGVLVEGIKGRRYFEKVYVAVYTGKLTNNNDYSFLLNADMKP